MSKDSVPETLLIYKIACLLSGAVSIVLGYLLFQHGILGPNGTLEARKDAYTFALTAGPGIFFALFGASVIAVTVYKGFSLDRSRNSQQVKGLQVRPNMDMDHEYETIKHWFDRMCLSVRDAHDHGEFSTAKLAEFNMHSASLAAAIDDLFSSFAPKRRPDCGEQHAAEEKTIGIASAPPG
jgi:hypothetical protein